MVNGHVLNLLIPDCAQRWRSVCSTAHACRQVASAAAGQLSPTGEVRVDVARRTTGCCSTGASRTDGVASALCSLAHGRTELFGGQWVPYAKSQPKACPEPPDAAATWQFFPFAGGSRALGLPNNCTDELLPHRWKRLGVWHLVGCADQVSRGGGTY